MWKKMMIGFMIAVSLRWASAQVPPFPFGNSTNDIILPRGSFGFSGPLALPIPMAYSGGNVTSVLQYDDGYITLGNENVFLVGAINIYPLFINTIRGGDNQNQISVRVGNKSTDLLLARDIIAGNGTIFNPKAIIVATWNNVEGEGLQAGIQNTFQLSVPFSDTGETWGIFAFSRLEFFSTSSFSSAKTFLVGPVSTQTFFETNSNAAMIERLTGTNCNRTGVYVFRISKGGPTNAPTNAPTVAPTEAPSTAPSVAPTEAPTTAPSVTPSKSPSTAPSATPSKSPTTVPTVTPSKFPTTNPTHTPTALEKCGLFGWSLLCPSRHPVWFLLTLAGLVPTILFILVHV